VAVWSHERSKRSRRWSDTLYERSWYREVDVPVGLLVVLLFIRTLSARKALASNNPMANRKKATDTVFAFLDLGAIVLITTQHWSIPHWRKFER
jgi:hypothetical protein